MSVEAMSLVLNHSRAKGAAKLILLGIANHAGDGGSWPSIATLARYANIDVRNVRRNIAALVEMGELRVKTNSGGLRGMAKWERPNLYHIMLTPPGASATTPPGASATLTTLEPSFNHPTPQTPQGGCPPQAAGGARYPDTFEQFWAAYPRKTGKGAAYKAWEKAIKHTPIEQIQSAVEVYRADPNQPLDQTLIPMPATWLNQSRWDDGPLPERREYRMSSAEAGMGIGQRMAEQEQLALIRGDYLEIVA